MKWDPVGQAEHGFYAALVMLYFGLPLGQIFFMYFNITFIPIFFMTKFVSADALHPCQQFSVISG